MVCVRTPGTPSSKIDRPPISTPGASTRTDRTPILTPGGMSTKTDNYSNGNSNSNRTPGGMACKTDRTPGSARMDRTLISTPGTSTKAASAVVGSGRVKEEKIFVTVRVRPLSNKEIAHRDQIAWECQTDNTISFKISASSHDRPNSSYTFDKVFGPTCRTDDVYEKGAKNVALSALTGINATIFAYGQTSSGKTFTMRGITESAVNDIYSHIQNSPERNFTIKMSALEIYNENVRDLLKPDSGPLRLLDDPEKGTVVEKLEEETVKDNKHLRYLIGICEAQRQVGETSLNDTSSRSHQIIRLTIESSLREASDCVQSFLACLNFVDLAGSERVSQTHTEGTRLKEGCHINRSLLTLTTVIRKLSSGKKGGHVPYRDSKLTRILQLSLGGNARTAIICTLSPALSHVEQSRNTLSFATRAKEVTNTAQVNMVISDKKLVKHLQKEVARLEAELRTPELSRTSEELLMEKEMKIKKMEMEMEALKRDRDLAQSQLDELQKKVNINQPGWNPFESPRRPAKCLTFSGNLPDSNKSRRVDTMRRSMMMRQSSTAPLMLVNEIRKLEHMQEQLGEEAKRALEVLQKEVACHRLGNQDAAETISKLQAEIREMLVVRSLKKDDLVGTNAKGNTEGSSTGATNLKEEITRLHNQGSTIANLEEQLENVQKSLDKLVLSLPNNNNNDETQKSQSKKKEKKKKKMLPLALSNSVNLIRSPCSPHSMMSSRAVAEDENENRNPLDDGDDEDNIYHVALVSGSEKTTTNIPITPSKSEDGNISSRDGTSPCHRRSSSVNVRKMQKMFQNAAEENVRSIKSYVTELKERVAKLQYQKQLLVCQVLELESNETSHDDNNAGDDETITDLQELPEDEESWSSIFKEQRNLIIQLWDVCHVSLIHRTQFYLLFQGDDSSDQIYMEVELRRLTWLQQHFVQSSNEPSSATTNSGADDLQTVTLASSIRALKSEREFLSKRMNSRLSEEEREMLYNKWQIPVYAKQRKLQLACKLWTDPTDPVHIEECAQLVAKLVGFCESGNNMSKAMFELNFALPEGKKPWMLGWNPITNLLRL